MCRIKFTKINAVAIMLLLALSFQLLGSSLYKSIASDEVLDLGAGYFYLRTGDFGLNPTHPPLSRLLTAAPLLALNLNFSTDWESSKEYNVVKFPIDLFYVYNHNIDTAFLFGRIPVMIISLILGIYIFLWSSRLFGKRAGLFALFLYSFSPIVLGHFTLTMTDPWVAAFSFIAMYHFWTYLKNPTRRNLLISGVALGLAISSKATGLFLIPIFIIMLLYGFRQSGKRMKNIINKSALLKLFAILLIGATVFAGVYGFEFRTMRSTIFNEDNLAKLDQMGGLAGHMINNIPIPFAFFFKGLYIESIPDVVYGKGPVYLFGELRQAGFPHYFISGFLMKTPIPLLIFLLASVIVFRKQRKDNLTELAILLPIVVWMLIFSFSKMGFGLRHILPVYPFIFLFVGRIVNINPGRGKSFGVSKKTIKTSAVVLLSVWYVWSSVAIFPDYLSYFNEFVGPENGYNCFIGYQGSGENMKMLGEYMEANGIDKIKFAKYGSWIPYEAAYRNISYEDFCGETEGIVVIGIRYLKGLRGNTTCYDWLGDYEPIASVGHSLIVYNITS